MLYFITQNNSFLNIDKLYQSLFFPSTKKQAPFSMLVLGKIISNVYFLLANHLRSLVRSPQMIRLMTTI